MSADGATFETEAAVSGDITKWVVKSGSDRIHAQAKNLSNDRVDVWLECIPYQGSVQALGMGGYAAISEGKGKSTLGGQVRALMPGRITSVLVKEGEVVRDGTPIFILEAMKMQN